MNLPPGSRILFLQRSLPPDHSAAGALVFDLARALATMGFFSTLAGTSSDPRLPLYEVREGIRILRTVCPSPQGRGSWGRLKSLLLAQAKLWPMLWREDPPDLLVTWTDPPLSEIPGSLLARWKSIPHVHWCQDLYPELLPAAGLLSSGNLFYKLLERAARQARARSNAVVCVGRCMQKHLGPSAVFLPNWTRVPTAPQPPSAAWREELGATSRTLVLYAGNLGRVHDFSPLVTAVVALEKAPFTFAIAGSGPLLSNLKKELAGCRNVRFLPVLDRESYEDLLFQADVHLVTLREEFCGLVVPSKLYDVAATGKAVVFTGPEQSEGALALRENAAGWVVAPRSQNSLAGVLQEIRQNPEESARRGAAAQRLLGQRRVAAAAQEFIALTASFPLPSRRRISA
jgi:colanic acid biosynthesis glycosyl transferase WcaI